MSMLSKTSAPLLKQSLDAYAVRHQVISQNIANAVVRDYRPLKVSFEERLQEALGHRVSGQKSHPRHLPLGRKDIRVVSNPESLERSEQPVNLEEEMAEMAKNQIRFEFAVRRLAGAYQILRMSITGRVS